MSTQRVAVFVDVENVTGWIKTDSFQEFLVDIREHGEVVGKAYGNWSLPALSAHQRTLAQLGLELIHTWHPVSKKNSADIRMSIDILESALTDARISTYVLMTGDSDFTPVFRRLYQLGKDVWGIGPESVLSHMVRPFCSRYVVIGSAVSVDEPLVISHQKPAVEPVPDVMQQGNLKSASHLALQILKASERPMNLSILKNNMIQQLKGFDEKELGIKSFSDFIRQVPGITLVLQGKVCCADLEKASFKKKTTTQHLYEMALEQ